MTTKKKEQAKVVSQEQLADGIFSMWIQTEAAGSARPGQFISMYTNDGSKLLPRPISICEIDKEGGKLRVVYRVTGEKTGTEEFSQMKAGDTIPVIGPLGNGFPFEKAEGKKVFLMGGGIGVPPILELAKQMECEKKQIVVGYRDAHTFLKEEFDKLGGMDDYKEFIHFGLTSQDINNTSIPLSVKEALSDIEAGNTQILVADKEYYKQHKETFKSWKVLKTSHRFQNEHRLFMQKDGKLQEIYSKGIKALETNGSLEHFSNTL